MKHKIFSVMLAVLTMAGASILTAPAETITVTSLKDDGTGTLRQAIADAANGDEIKFSCTLDGKTITLDSALTVNKSVTILGGGQKLVPAASGYPAIHQPSSTSGVHIKVHRIWFDGFYNSGGAGRNWGGAFSGPMDGYVTFTSCIFTGNNCTGAGASITKVWGEGQGSCQGVRAFLYGNTFYSNGAQSQVTLHHETATAVGNIFYNEGASTSIDDSSSGNGNCLDDTNHFYDYNYFNGKLANLSYETTNNVELTANPLGTDLVPTNTSAVLPTQLPEDYPKVDFYGNPITEGGKAGALQAGYTPDPNCAVKPVTGVSLEQRNIKIKAGVETARLRVIIEPSDASDQTVTWKSDDETIATVSDNGIVSGLKAGTTTVTVTTNDGGFKAQASITVTEPQACKLKYDAIAGGWAIAAKGGGHGWGTKGGGADKVFDGNISTGWHRNIASNPPFYLIIDMKESKEVSSIILRQDDTDDHKADFKDIQIYLTDTELSLADLPEVPVDAIPAAWGEVKASATDLNLSGLPATERFVDLKITGEDTEGQYLVLYFPNTGNSGSHLAVGEVEVYPECPVQSWDISAVADITNTVVPTDSVVATLSADGETLTIGGRGRMKDFYTVYTNKYTGGGAPWVVDLEVADGAPLIITEDDDIVSATLQSTRLTIENIIIEEGVTNIGNSLAWGLTNLYSVAFPVEIDSIGTRAFSAHKLNMRTLQVPDSVKKIGSYAFEGSTNTIVEGEDKITFSFNNVAYIILPAVLDTVSGHAFDGMPGTESVSTYAKTPPKIAETTFAGVDKTTAVLNVPFGKSNAYKAADYWKEFAKVEELPVVEEIPEVPLPYTPGNKEFADDILPFLNGSYPDKNNDGVVAFKFTITEGGKLTAECPGYTLYLFDNEELVSDNEIAKAVGSIANKELEPGTYYLAVDKESITAVTSYNLSIVINKDGVANADRTVKSVTQYDLLGRQLRSNATGIVIRRITYDDGSIETTKVYIKD